jgi:cytochrome b6-f complex iron-sulfur subunit
MTSTNREHTQIKRRRFLKNIWAGIGIIASFEVIGIVFNFFHASKNKNTLDETNYFDAGPLSSFKKNSVTSFRNRNFFLTRLENGDFIALSARCTHLGCSLTFDKEKKQLVCPCHSSIFDIKGKVLRSPASRSLDLHEVIVDKGVVKVNTSAILGSSDKFANQTTNFSK